MSPIADDELRGTRDPALAHGPFDLVEDDHRQHRRAPSTKIGAWSAANEPLMPTPSSTIVIVSHHTTRSVASAVRGRRRPRRVA